MLHEISHMWFNDLLFSTRWIDEGLAHEYAARAVAGLGGKLATPHAVNMHSAAAIPLETWSVVDLQAQNSHARETFGYNASWLVIHELTDEIGVDAMRRIIAAASKDAIPYVGTSNPEAAGGAGSWKRFLDYLDETGGSKKADALFAKYVAPPSDTSIAQQTRAAYTQLVRTSAGWKAPLVLRQAMTNWDFATAQTLITTANQLTIVHAAIDKTLAPLGLRAPTTLQADYQYKDSDLVAVQKEANTDLAAAKVLAAASAAVHGHHGVFATIGLIGSRDSSDLSSARRSFSAGELRLGGAAGAIVLIALAVWLLRRRSRRRDARGTEPDVGPEPGPGLPPDHGAGPDGPENGEVVAGPAG